LIHFRQIQTHKELKVLCEAHRASKDCSAVNRVKTLNHKYMATSRRKLIE